MSRFLPGEQVEHAFNPKRLQNWEVPQEDTKGLQNTTGGTRFGTLQPRDGKTQFIVDEKGHLLPGTTKINNSFKSTVPVHQKSSARWPTVNAAIPQAGRSTMGYKGIVTDYLPTSTVAVKSVEVAGAREFNYSFR